VGNHKELIFIVIVKILMYDFNVC